MTFAPTFSRTFQPTFDRRNATGNGLLNALIAYWPGNEASGNALDLHTNGLTLTDVQTVTNAAGKVYATARQYTLANKELHTRTDNAYLSTGDVDWTLAGWVYQDTSTGVQYWVSKYNTTATVSLEYGSYLNAARFTAFVGDGTNVIGSVTANTFGAISTGVWYLVVWWHDSVANTVNIQVNNTAPDSSATTGAPVDGTASFSIGAAQVTTGIGTAWWSGRIGPTMFWKSAAGAGGVLTATQRTALYNAGAGLAYAAFTT